MVIDTFTYNGEADMLEIRLNMLYEYVDQFIIVEFDKTFSGKPKPSYYMNDRKRFKQFEDKIKYINYSEDHYARYYNLAECSPNTQGAEHWKREFAQKESIRDSLTHLSDDDVVFIGDVDEVWEGYCRYLNYNGSVIKLPLRVYTYYLNNRSSEQFFGTSVGLYKHWKEECSFNHIRSNPSTNREGGFDYCGWHFTSMGGYEKVKRKLGDSYTEESYWTKDIKDNLRYNVENQKDFLGRDFTYKIDESEWPDYLKENKEKYSDLCL